MKFKELNPSDGMEVLIADKRLIYNGAWYCDGVPVEDGVLTFLQDTECKVVPVKGKPTTVKETLPFVKVGDKLLIEVEITGMDDSDAPILVSIDNDEFWLNDDTEVILC